MAAILTWAGLMLLTAIVLVLVLAAQAAERDRRDREAPS